MGLIIGIVVISLALLFLLFKSLTWNHKSQELKSKTDFALSSDALMKVVYESNGVLGDLATNFNALIERYQSLRKDSYELKAESDEKRVLDDKVKSYENSFSKINLLTDIGRKITASLNVDEIFQTVYHFIRSSMDVEELELLYYSNNELIYIGIDKSNKLSTYSKEQVKSGANVMNWAIKNKKEVFLNDAIADYKQYVFDQIITFQGWAPNAVICIPLFLHENPVGAIAVVSKNKEVFNEYHLEFLRTLASYLAVALDNSNVYGLLELGKKVIEEEKAKSDKLLLNILPAEIAEELKEKGSAKARDFEDASILFTDFKGFTQISEKLSAVELVGKINFCFQHFDHICEKYGIEKIKTIGDSYMAAGGIPVHFEECVKNTVLAAIEMCQFILDQKKEHDAQGKIFFEMRTGVHTGSIVAGIVGVKKFQYDIWGDTVNTASRIESTGEVGEVNISYTTYLRIQHEPEFDFVHRGKLNAKGKGEIDMYFARKKRNS